MRCVFCRRWRDHKNSRTKARLCAVINRLALLTATKLNRMRSILHIALLSGLITGATACFAKVAGIGVGGSFSEGVALGILLGIAGGFPISAALFALLHLLSCNAARSRLRQTLLGALIGPCVYMLCVLVAAILATGFGLNSQSIDDLFKTYPWWLVVPIGFALLSFPAIFCALVSYRYAASAPRMN